MAIMIELNYKTFFAETNLILSVCSLMFALMVGTLHAHILSTLIIDLKTLKCQSEADYLKVRRLQLIFRIAVYVWLSILLINVVFFIIVRKYGYTMLVEAILFALQAFTLVKINMELNRVLSSLFNNDQFQKERRFLQCTLIVFTISYFVVIVRSFTIFGLIQHDSLDIKRWVCLNNFEVNLINVVSYVFIDLVPIGTIFWLHWKNFREEAKKEYML